MNCCTSGASEFSSMVLSWSMRISSRIAFSAATGSVVLTYNPTAATARSENGALTAYVSD